MALQQLEINKFSNEGEVLRKIRCLAGRVTVFRSQSEAELDKFKRALEGKPQSERFSVLLDGGPYHPSKHIFIGCGPLDEAPPHSAVGIFLTESGIQADAIEGLLTQFGLGGLSQQQCTSLSPHEWKVLRMIGAFHSPQALKVIVLHEPFDEIPDSFKDPLADRLAKFAWEKQAIVIVTKLSYRPSVWIENDYIARVQLERPRQGTIGFGGGESAIAEHLATLRKEHGVNTDPQKKNPTTDLLETKNDSVSTLVRYIQSPRVAGLTFSLFVMVFGLLYYLWQTSAPLGSEPQVIASQTSGLQGHVQAGTNSDLTAISSDQAALQPSARVTTPLLDGYPEVVRSAWIAAIEHPQSLLRPVGKNTTPSDGSDGSAQGAQVGDSPIEALYKELTK